MLRSFLAGLLFSSAMVLMWPAAASAQQFGQNSYTYYGQSQSGWSYRQQTFGGSSYGDPFEEPIYSDRSERLDGFRQPSTVMIIQQSPFYAYPASTCSTSVAGSPIPLPYARDTRTGLPCN
jgi:hypothetical protein